MIAAGGIADGRGLAAALMLGAAGIGRYAQPTPRSALSDAGPLLASHLATMCRTISRSTALSPGLGHTMACRLAPHRQFEDTETRHSPS